MLETPLSVWVVNTQRMAASTGLKAYVKHSVSLKTSELNVTGKKYFLYLGRDKPEFNHFNE